MKNLLLSDNLRVSLIAYYVVMSIMSSIVALSFSSDKKQRSRSCKNIYYVDFIIPIRLGACFLSRSI